MVVNNYPSISLFNALNIFHPIGFCWDAKHKTILQYFKFGYFLSSVICNKGINSVSAQN